MVTNEENDIYMDGTNDIAVSYEKEALAECIDSLIRCQLGEVQYNNKIGIPYFETVFSFGLSKAKLWESYVIEAIESFEDVISVRSFEYKVDNGKIKYEALIQTRFGDVSLGDT